MNGGTNTVSHLEHLRIVTAWPEMNDSDFIAMTTLQPSCCNHHACPSQ